MKDVLNSSYNSGGIVYLLQSVAIHFNLTGVQKYDGWDFVSILWIDIYLPKYCQK